MMWTQSQSHEAINNEKNSTLRITPKNLINFSVEKFNHNFLTNHADADKQIN